VVGGAEVRKVNPKQRDLALAAAEAAARRLLVRVIDLRFDLEDAADLIEAQRCLRPDELQNLRTDADVVRHEIELLVHSLRPSADSVETEAGEVSGSSSQRLSR
jgi:hypothetical protein